VDDRKGTVLIVDDTPANLQLLESILHDRGYQVRAAISGRMALADVYDALTSRRVYKPAFTHDRAFEIITVGDGRTVPEQFDPAVLQAFVALEGSFRAISDACKDEDAR
jgi:response regulator RpfG family c-di-GMP phosphodiesterase